MALNLVAYGASDDESDESTDETSGTVAVVIKAPSSNKSGTTEPARKTASVLGVNAETGEIPKPSQRELELAELAKREKANLSSKSDLLASVTQKKGGRIVIGIPSLAELEDDVDEKKVKKPTFSAGKGQSKLFNKLPPPKNAGYEPPISSSETSGAAVKQSVSKKSLPLIPQAVAKKLTVKKGSDDEDDDSSTTNGSFFTMDEPALKEVHVLEPVPMVAYAQPPVTQPYSAMHTNQEYNLAGIPDSVIMEQQHAAQMELDDVALQALQGTSGTKRKLPDDARVIDIQGEKLTYDPNLSYLKSMSEERVESRGPDITYNKLQKKKHQITYLAAQAKAREVELKNQWAQNKSTKRQTQAKYGF